MSRGHWGKGNDVGRIYRVTSVDLNRISWNRIKEGDLLLCVRHTGDFHFQYVVLEPNTDNGDSVYFSIIETVSGYALAEEAFPLARTLDDRSMLNMMLQKELILPCIEIHGDWTVKEDMIVYQRHSNNQITLVKDSQPGFWQPVFSYNKAPYGPARDEEDLRKHFSPRLL